MVRKLGDFKALSGRDVPEHLRRAAGGPVNLQHGDPFGLAQADRLLQGVRPEAASRGNVTVNSQRRLPGGHDLDARTERRPVRLLADELDRDRVLSLSRVLEENVMIF